LSGSSADVAPDVGDRQVALVRELENVGAFRLGDFQLERRSSSVRFARGKSSNWIIVAP
jgi:hypothetical protein